MIISAIFVILALFFLFSIFSILNYDKKIEKLVVMHQKMAIRRFFEEYGRIDDISRPLIIIPAYDEEKNIGQVIGQIRKLFPNFNILVINDGSNDNTKDIANKMGAKVASHIINLGDGAALQTGFKIALQNNIRTLIEMDADGQHPVNEIPRLIKPIINKEADVVIGSRFLEKTNYKTSIPRLIGIYFYSMITSLLLRQRLTDVPSGFRAYNKKAYAMLSEKLPRRNASVAMLLYLGLKGCKIKEIPVKMFPRKHGCSKGLTIKYFVLYPVRCIYNSLKILAS